MAVKEQRQFSATSARRTESRRCRHRRRRRRRRGECRSRRQGYSARSRRPMAGKPPSWRALKMNVRVFLAARWYSARARGAALRRGQGSRPSDETCAAAAQRAVVPSLSNSAWKCRPGVNCRDVRPRPDVTRCLGYAANWLAFLSDPNSQAQAWGEAAASADFLARSEFGRAEARAVGDF